MKKSILFSILILAMSISTAYAQGKSPLAVSPASELGIATVRTVCPTFSWTAVDWAAGYRVEVFPVEENPDLKYDTSAAHSLPLLVKEIPGAATSWTPSSDEPLRHDGVYVWFVQALDEYGAGAWSEGRIFRIEAGAGIAAVKEAVSSALEKHGVGENIIDDVIDRMTNAAEGSGIDTLGTIPMNVQGNETGNNTWYGQYAGSSITTGSFNSLFGYSAGQDISSAYHNTMMGYYAGRFNTGSYNSFFGDQAGRSNSTGEYNTFLGASSGWVSTTGSNNTFIGYSSGYYNTSGHNNVFSGYRAGRSNTTGYRNVFIGSNAGLSNTTGDLNVFLGYLSGNVTETANYNTFLGAYSGQVNTTGSYNVFSGCYAGYSNTTGYENLFVGYSSGANNTVGYRNTFLGHFAGNANSSADHNTFVGYTAGESTTTAGYNTFLGSLSGSVNTTGIHNTFVGINSGNQNASGGRNVFFGSNTGYVNTAGSYNTYLGYMAGHDATGSENVFIGSRAGYYEAGSARLYIANSDTSNPLIFGDFSENITAVSGDFGVGTKSPDFPMELERTGTNASIVVDRTDGATNYINATDSYGNFGTVTNHPLRLVTNSQWRVRINSDNSLTLKNGASCTPGGVWTDASSRELKENINVLTAKQALDALLELQPVVYNYKADTEDAHVGFIAEDVPDLVASQDRKGMSPMDVVAVLTKVLQEQQKTIDELRSEVEKLKQESDSEK